MSIPKSFTHLPTIFIYPSNIELVHKGNLTEVIKGSDKYLKGRFVKVLSNKIKIWLEDGGITSFKSTSIRLIDPDHIKGDSIPIPHMPLRYTEIITRK